MTLTQAELEAIAAEPYESRGIIHSEMALILHTCRRLGIEAVVESGRARGQSTYMLAKYLPHAQIISIEFRTSTDQAFGIERVKDFANVTLIEGDGRIALPLLARNSAPKLTAVLCDGPKGAAAVEVVQHCFTWPHVRIGFVHDMSPLDHRQPSAKRAAALAAFPNAKFSDDHRLVAGSKWMDAKVLEAGGPCGPEWEKEFGSWGPTVGVILNQPELHKLRED